MSDNYTEIKTIKREEIHHYASTAKDKKWCILRIEPWWDTDKMLADLRTEMSGLTMRAKDPELYKEFYEGISIQHTVLDKTEESKNFSSVEKTILPGEPIYRKDGVVYFTENGFSSTPLPKFTPVEMNDSLQSIFEMLISKPAISAPQYFNEWATAWIDLALDLAKEKIMFVRGRYLKSHPQQYANKHKDNECRIHFPVYTNDKCFFTFFEDVPYEPKKYKQLGKFNLPADGNAYMFNAFVSHNFGNLGSEDRTHAVFGLQTIQHAAWQRYQKKSSNI